MNAPKELGDFYAHEALDRTEVVISIIDEHLRKHLYIQGDPKLVDWVEEAQHCLAQAYQYIGAKHL